MAHRERPAVRPVSEHLWALASPRGAQLDAISRGGKPEWTQKDVALAAAGLDRIAFKVALFSLAGDDSVRGTLRTWLLEALLEERERQQWATWVNDIWGERIKFAEALCELYLLEERRPAPFQAVPNLRSAAIKVEPETWRAKVSHQYAFLQSLYHERLLAAADHVRRRLRRPIDGTN